MSTVQFDGNMSSEFEVKSGVKQGCVLAPTLFGIFFALLLKHAFKSTRDGVYLHSRSDVRLFNISRLRTKTKSRKVTIRDLLFADDAVLVSQTARRAPETNGQVLRPLRPFSVSQSAERRPRSWDKDHHLRLTQQSTVKNWKLSTSFSTWAPLLPTSYLWKWSSARASARHQQHSPNLPTGQGALAAPSYALSTYACVT